MKDKLHLAFECNVLWWPIGGSMYSVTAPVVGWSTLEGLIQDV